MTSPLAAARAEQVWSLLAGAVQPLSVIECAAASASGRTLAEPILATADHPPFDRAVMDGYALRARDAAGAGDLPVVGLARAGATAAGELPPGACVQINTGGVVPDAADSIAIVEHCERVTPDTIRVTQPVRVGEHIERRGAILHAGDPIAAAGTRVNAGTLAAIVAAGIACVRVHPAPRVAILTTGDELIPAGADLAPGRIFDSNSHVLRVLCEDAGATVESLTHAPDDPAALHAAVRAAMRNDLLVITGGMSKGSHDYVPRTLESLGVRWHVTSLDLKPGKPTRLGQAPSGAWVAGLPGNPVSCTVCFLLFVRPLLAALQGRAFAPPSRLTGLLAAGLAPNGARPMFHPALWQADTAASLRVQPRPWRGSGDPFALAGANALIYRAPHAPAAQTGDAVEFVPFELPG